jgi:hypothetical protein
MLYVVNAVNNVTYMIVALLGDSSVDAVRYATVEEAMFSAWPIGWRAVTSRNSTSDHVMCVIRYKLTVYNLKLFHETKILTQFIITHYKHMKA